MLKKFMTAGVVAAIAMSASAQTITTQVVSSGLDRPVFATHAPGDFNHLYIVEKKGVIKVLDMSSGTTSVFMDINSVVVNISSGNDERGLLGLAFHPDFVNNNLFYVNYINNSSDTVIAQYTANSATSGDAGSRVQLMLIDQPQSNHNGGWIGFSPRDDYLYIGVGDGGGANDVHGAFGNGQNLDTLLGKMLRIDVDGSNGPGGNYGIPADNPFVGIAGEDEIWAWGLRNPWRNSFDRNNGDLYIADVGQNVWEEVNRQLRTSDGGENYGWRCFEGNANFNTGGPTCGSGDMVFPNYVYSHSEGCSITGGYVYRGCAVPELWRKYIFADYCNGALWALSPGAYDTRTSLGPDFGFGVTSFGEDAFGEVYVITGTGTTTGAVRRITSLTPPADDSGNGTADVCDCVIGDWNEDGLLNTADFLAYLNDYSASVAGGTITYRTPDLATPFGVVNTSDFLAYLNHFNGCP